MKVKKRSDKQETLHLFTKCTLDLYVFDTVTSAKKKKNPLNLSLFLAHSFHVSPELQAFSSCIANTCSPGGLERRQVKHRCKCQCV